MTNGAANMAIADNIAVNEAAANVAETANSITDTAAALPAWHDPFCSRYANLLFEYGRWFLLAALIIGTIGALAGIVKLFSGESGGDEEEGGTILQSTVAAVTALVDSLAKAPTWIAMLGAGLVLMWMSGQALPAFCDGPEAEPEVEVPAPSKGPDTSTNASKDDESGG